MIDATAICTAAPQHPHQDAMDLLCQQLTLWFKQLEEFDHNDPARARDLRKRCLAVRKSINILQEAL